MRWILGLALAAALSLRAAEVEIGGSAEAAKAPASSFSSAPSTAPPPVPQQAGDVPTGYGISAHETRFDVRFYEGGGIVGKAVLGLWDRLYVGGGATVRGFIGGGNLSMVREDAQLLARLLALKEDKKIPALALGWDGPAYERGELRGLYLALSKEFPTALGYFQAHGSASTGKVEQFVGERDLRFALAVTTTLSNISFYTELDELRHPAGARWNAGIQVYFDPITLGIDFHDMGYLRTDTPSTRVLKVSWVGTF